PRPVVTPDKGEPPSTTPRAENLVRPRPVPPGRNLSSLLMTTVPQPKSRKPSLAWASNQFGRTGTRQSLKDESSHQRQFERDWFDSDCCRAAQRAPHTSQFRAN